MPLLVGVTLLSCLPLAAQQSGAPAAPRPEGPSQQPPVTFRAEINYVEVDARVVDAAGRFVPGLQQADFQVLEDGKPQQVSVFSFVNIPVERADQPLFTPQPIEPDVASNVRGTDGRIYLLVLDDLHTLPQRSLLTRRAARRFVERYLGANDAAAVVYTSGRTDVSQEFTSSRRRLLAAIDAFLGRRPRGSTLERIDEEQRTRDFRQQGDRVTDPLLFERGYNARTSLDSLRRLADYMAGVSGRRKALVLFSEGIDYDITDPFNNQDATAVQQASREAIAAATRANVAVYGIDPRGLTQLGDDMIEVASLPEDPQLRLGASAFQDELRLAQDSLRVLSSETGGFAVVNRNDFDGAFDRIVADNSSYYVLGYYSTNTRRDGRFRRIDVKVSRPGLTVRARKGYAAARGRAPEEKRSPNAPSPALRAAIASPLPVSALPLEATAAVFKGAAPNGAVVLSTLVGTRDLPLTEKDGAFQNALEQVVTAVDYRGKTYDGGRRTVTLNLKPDSVPRVRAAGFRMLSQIDLPPGRYQVRIAVAESGAGRSGSVLVDLDVPDFAKAPFTMSSLALTSATSQMGPTAREKDPLARMLPGPLTTFREFPVGDELALFAEVYDRTTTQPHTVEIAATLRAEGGGQVVFQTREERDSRELAGGPGGYGFSARIPLKAVAPGVYVLRVEATSRAASRDTVVRETVIRVTAPPATSQP